MNKYLTGTAMLLLVVGLTMGGYYLNRHLNWSWGYEDMVEKKIKQMVKEGALKDER